MNRNQMSEDKNEVEYRKRGRMKELYTACLLPVVFYSFVFQIID